MIKNPLLSVVCERDAPRPVLKQNVQTSTTSEIAMLVTILIFAVGLSIQQVAANENIVVHTQYGDVLGYQTDMARVFYGIPFAQPPVGTLRYITYASVFHVEVPFY